MGKDSICIWVCVWEGREEAQEEASMEGGGEGETLKEATDPTHNIHHSGRGRQGDMNHSNP